MEQVQNKNKGGIKELIEDQNYLSISDFGRGLLRQWEEKGKSGEITISGLGGHVDYEVSPRCGVPFLNLSTLKADPEIELEGVPITFGIKPYFKCQECHARRTKLYQGKNNQYLCRVCLDLAYQSTRITMPLLKSFWQHQRLIERSESVKRITYGGCFTRKAKTVMRMADKLAQSQKF